MCLFVEVAIGLQWAVASMSDRSAHVRSERGLPAPHATGP